MSFCRHFGTCGGCVLQDKTQSDYRALKLAALQQCFTARGLQAVPEDIFIVPPGTRRRATFKALRRETGTQLGFHEARSHSIVDLEECRVLTPALAALIPGLRAMLTDILKPGESAELKVTDALGGADLSLRWARKNDPVTIAALARWADKLKLARISRHGEILVEQIRPQVAFGPARVDLPREAFLQPTREGEAALQGFVTTALAKAKKVADLFSGCGTFSLPLAQKASVHAVELEADHLEALVQGSRQPGFRPVTVEKRNLFKRPLTVSELKSYDGVCLDPPRAGAEAQAQELAGAHVKFLAYVSCDAASFARDAAILIAGGYTLRRLIAVDQFLWSDHIELAAAFTKPPKRFP